MSPFELSEAIHKFHQGPARDLYVKYEMKNGMPEWLVAGAIARGVITREELPEELLETVKSELSYVESMENEEGEQ